MPDTSTDSIPLSTDTITKIRQAFAAGRAAAAARVELDDAGADLAAAEQRYSDAIEGHDEAHDDADEAREAADAALDADLAAAAEPPAAAPAEAPPAS